MNAQAQSTRKELISRLRREASTGGLTWVEGWSDDMLEGLLLSEGLIPSQRPEGELAQAALTVLEGLDRLYAGEHGAVRREVDAAFSGRDAVVAGKTA